MRSGPGVRAAALAVLALGAAGGAVRSDALPERAQPVVDYSIEVRLHPDKKELTGRERVVWRNPSADSVGELWFHLYLNAFRNNRSTFYRESGGGSRGDRAAKDDWGWIDVTELKRGDGRDLLPALTFEHPDDDNAEDRTVARVRLPEAVPPGGEITLDIAFVDRLPEVYARTGWDGEFFAVGQWFPKLAVYEPAGTRGRTSGGWNAHQFHGNSEFYADYGNYRVEITAPSRFIVGATGRRVAERAGGGTTTFVYEQSDVHDFNWTADPGFVEIDDTFSAERDVTPEEYAEAARRLGRSLEEVRLTDVAIRLLLQPSHRPQAGRHLRALKLAIKSFGLWFGRYPYPNLTLVDPRATGASGVEYPTLIYGGTSDLYQHWPFETVREPEITAVHEFAHQYWYGLVGSNEFEEAWMDEGFTTYSTDLAMEAGYGPRGAMISLLGLEIGAVQWNRLPNALSRRLDSPRNFAWRYSPRQYGFYSYARPSLVLHTLAGVVGDETMARIMRTYHERWRFRHPRGEDFYAVASEVAGRDLSAFFAQTMEKPGVFAPAVVSLSSEPRSEPRGRLTDDLPAKSVSESEARARAAEAEAQHKTLYHSVVELRQRGEIALPVEVELAWENGPPERRTWSGEERWARWEIDRPQRLLAVTIDPDRKLPLDSSWLDNARRLEPDGRAAAQWSARFLFWMQQAVSLFGF
jgi:hypothetical protein